MSKRKNKNKRTKRSTKVVYPTPSSNLNIPNLETVSEKIPYRKLYPVFSFKYYDDKNAKFSVKCFKNYNELCLLFKHLKMASQLTWGEMEKANSFHAHEFNWKQTSQPQGFPATLYLPEGFPPYQFKALDKYRVVGFHMNKVFYIVWFDDHKIFPK